MLFRRVCIIGIMATGLTGLGFFMGCTRQLDEPVAQTLAPKVPTLTPTLSPTATVTSTPTATPNARLILDDFKGTGGSGSDSVTQLYVQQDEAGHWRDGSWFAVNDVGVTTILSGTGMVDPTCVEQNITFNPTGTSGYDQLGFNFTNPAGTNNAGISFYDATVGGRYTGISFWAKVKTMPSTVCGASVPFWVDFVDNGAVTDHSVAVPFTTTWQQYTVFYNQAGWDQLEDGNSTALKAVSIEAVKFEPQNLGTNNFNIDFLIDDVQLTNATQPASPTAPSPTLLTDFEDGANHVVFNNSSPFYAGTASPWSGYWYVFDDGTALGTTECPNGSVSGTAFFPDAPGCNTTTLANDPQNFAAHMFGMVGTANPPNYPYAGMGFNFEKPAGPYDASAFANSLSHGIQFYVKWGPAWNSSTYATGFFMKFAEVETATAAEGGTCDPTAGKCDDHYCFNMNNVPTTSWQLYQLNMTTQYGVLTQQGWGTVAAWDPVSLLGVQVEFDNTWPGLQYDLWMDDISFF